MGTSSAKIPTSAGAKAAIQKREKSPNWTKALHTQIVPGCVLKGMFARDFKSAELLPASAAEHVQQTLERMAVRDPVEEMLLIQMMYTHQRVTELTAKASAQENLKWAQHFHDAADRAANTYRRQMLALAEYRSPPTNRSVSYIRQANLAEQQVVQNVDGGAHRSSRNATNEKGCRKRRTHSKQKALPALPRRADVAANGRSSGQALAADAGAGHARR